MNILKIVFISGASFLISCHNNAHLRTQKFLKKDESVISLSSVLPIGGATGEYLRYHRSGVIATRTEFSYLRGFGKYEQGLYGCFGFEGIAFGYDYKRYIKTGNPYKLGGQLELNLTSLGTVFHFKPSLTTITSKEKRNFFGLHGLLYNGSLRDFGHIDDWNDYRYSSLGGGVTFGSEFFYPNFSIQSQIDLSMVNNAFYMGDYNWDDGDDPYYADPGDNYYLLVGISAGVSLFNPPKFLSKSSEPMPLPIKPINQEHAKKFDPNTGEKIQENSSQFDPETGKKLSISDLNYDPNKGDIVNSISEEEYDINYDKELSSNIEVLSNYEISRLATEDANKAIVSPLWSLSGIASIPLGITGFTASGEIAIDVLELPFPLAISAPFVGGLIGFSIPYQFAKRVETEIKFPSKLKNDTQRLLYREIYAKKITKRRGDMIRKTQAIFGCLPIILLFGSLLAAI